MAIDNASVLENLKTQRVEIEKSIEGNREMYLKIIGAIEVLEQIEKFNANEAPETPETEVEGDQ